MKNRKLPGTVLAALCSAVSLLCSVRAPAQSTGSGPGIVLPLERTAYFAGEVIPVVFSNADPSMQIQLTAVAQKGRTILYSGKPAPILIDSSLLMPADYALEINGRAALSRLTIMSPIRRSAASLQDECVPPEPQRETSEEEHWEKVRRTFDESGLSACVNLAASDMGRARCLDTMARSGALMLVNPDTRPTSFLPVGNNPDELDGMSQRMILTAQANARYPNFGGFCFGWDTTGYAVGGRRMLLVYWGWGDKTDALRTYIERADEQKIREFERRTGLGTVTEQEYLSYLLSIGRPEFAPVIDLPTRVWVRELAGHVSPAPASDLDVLDRRIEAWSWYLMGLYNECYRTYIQNLRELEPSLRHTSSVQSDHCAVRVGQYFPSAYEPLDFRYQSVWNDQVGGPDYAYQWLLVDALLEMGRGPGPTWISTAMAAAHGRAAFPGKLVRVAAHGLAYGASGIGFACEGFSNLLGGMNRETNWEHIKGKSGEADVLSARDFLDRFASLALECRPDHGVAILWSKTQFARQHVAMGFGQAHYLALVALARLGYTPRFITEEEIAAGGLKDVSALVVVNQTFGLPPPVLAQAEAFYKRGGRIIADASSTITLPGAARLDYAFPFAVPGKPHNWGAPNMVNGENDAILLDRWLPAIAKALGAALGDSGRGVFKSDAGYAARTTLLQLDGGPDAKYAVAVNDSWIATQADWHAVRERLLPCHMPPGTTIYDCTAERRLGTAAPVECDLSRTTARVYACLGREIGRIALAAEQNAHEGSVGVSVSFLDSGGKPIRGVVPFCLSLRSGQDMVLYELYRSTDTEGNFRIRLPVPANLPAGEWTLKVRCQLDGRTASLPVRIGEARTVRYARAWNCNVIVRNRAALTKALATGSRVIIPLFETTNSCAAWLKPAAEKARTVLSAMGVQAEIWDRPPTNTYYLAYALNEAQKESNDAVDQGKAIGRLARLTVNANDWYSALSGWRFPLTVVLLDAAGCTGDCPMAESLDSHGLLWPAVSPSFPGSGRAVIQAVEWAFAPRATAIVVQASDADGLLAGVAAFSDPPADALTESIRQAREEIWRQFHIGGKPEQPTLGRLTSRGLVSGFEPQPFSICFPDAVPPDAADVRHPALRRPEPKPVPGTFLPRDFRLLYCVDGTAFETATAESLVPDLRFSEAIMLTATNTRPGPMKITARGVFRYSDRTPCREAQWEYILALRDKLIPRERRPVEFDVAINGRQCGKLQAVRRENREVVVNMNPRSTQTEEVVTLCEGEFEMPEGAVEIVLAQRNIVDGYLEAVGVGETPPDGQAGR